MEQSYYEKVLTLVTPKEVAEPLLNKLKNELDTAVNMFENDKDWGAAVAIGKAKAALDEFMDVWKEISK